ncbi:metallophosphoesterase [Stigmatella sp. ncwal1]|uniref:Metallophosphoesterase n=1 Tax=Stigmatella ashevillensis TaxID=2995309 RepID=A0ABT5DDN4_9BACT|nr:metallophosphoesterase [Stigmatella ashevillena]MDC0710446.1 metallophosphoesterase [Stigmatella ashevillena]
MSVSRMLPFIFLTVLSLLTVLGHLYLYRRLVRDTSPLRRWRRAAGGALWGLGALMLGSAMTARVLPPGGLRPIFFLGWMWMAAAAYLLLILWLVGGARLLARLGQRGRSAPPPSEAASPPAAASEERRQFLARSAAGGALLVTGGFVGYGTWRAFHPPVVNRIAVRLPGLPKALDGFTLVQVTDIHVGPLIQRRFMDAMVEQCNALKPDAVCITGDLVDGSVPALAPSVSALANLRSRYGSFFVTGNHEYYSGDEEWAEALERMGITVLRNRHVSVGEPGASFDMVGVDDWAAQRSGFPRKYDLERALAGRAPERASVLLAHQPSNWRVAAQKGIGLQLSGHTHGGQFFPFTLAVGAMWEHDAGHYEENGRHLYVSRGTGFWGPPVRVAAPPEIVQVTLLAS